MDGARQGKGICMSVLVSRLLSRRTDFGSYKCILRCQGAICMYICQPGSQVGQLAVCRGKWEIGDEPYYLHYQNVCAGRDDHPRVCSEGMRARSEGMKGWSSGCSVLCCAVLGGPGPFTVAVCPAYPASASAGSPVERA